jgi:hypothetical protein
MISFGMNGLIGWAPAFMTRELDLTVARTLMHMKYGAPGGVRPDPSALYGEFLSLVRQLAERADRLEV